MTPLPMAVFSLGAVVQSGGKDSKMEEDICESEKLQDNGGKYMPS